MTLMAPLTQLERDAPPLRNETVHRLEMLAGTLTERGLGASLVAPAGRVPRLQVAHPRLTARPGTSTPPAARAATGGSGGRGPSGSPRRATWTLPRPSSRMPRGPLIAQRAAPPDDRGVL